MKKDGEKNILLLVIDCTYFCTNLDIIILINQMFMWSLTLQVYFTLFDYLKRREFLLDETNKQKLLEEVPSVVPDVEDNNKDSPKSILTHSSSAPFGITSGMMKN